MSVAVEQIKKKRKRGRLLPPPLPRLTNSLFLSRHTGAHAGVSASLKNIILWISETKGSYGGGGVNPAFLPFLPEGSEGRTPADSEEFLKEATQPQEEEEEVQHCLHASAGAPLCVCVCLQFCSTSLCVTFCGQSC